MSVPAPNLDAVRVRCLVTEELASFSCLIKKLYKGPLEQRPWYSFLETLLAQVPSTFTYLSLCPANSVIPIYMVGASDTSAEKKYGVDVWFTSPFVNLPEDEVIAITEVVPPDQYENSNFYKMFLEPHNVYHMIGIDIKMPEGIRAHLRLSRSRAMGYYSPAE